MRKTIVTIALGLGFAGVLATASPAAAQTMTHGPAYYRTTIGAPATHPQQLAACHGVTPAAAYQLCRHLAALPAYRCDVHHIGIVSTIGPGTVAVRAVRNMEPAQYWPGDWQHNIDIYRACVANRPI